ncbi:hypothetical protein ACU4GD_11210 [Cupriavidus basilensis]
MARQGGETVCSSGASPDVARYRLMLPVSEPRSALDRLPARQGRPEFYDFDLFHQPGQNAGIDQCRLSQLQLHGVRYRDHGAGACRRR